MTERGHRCVEGLLERHGAPAREPGENPRDLQIPKWHVEDQAPKRALARRQVPSRK